MLLVLKCSIKSIVGANGILMKKMSNIYSENKN